MKTKTSRRTVELPKVTADALARHLELHPPVDVEITDETDRRAPRVRTARLVFTNNQSRAIHRATWSHGWAPAARAAGLPPDCRRGPGTTRCGTTSRACSSTRAPA